MTANSNMLDYLDWRGDLSMEEVPYGEVDELILAILVYGRLEKLGSSAFGKTVAELFPLLFTIPRKEMTGYEPERYDLWKAAAASRRFSTLKVDCFVESFDTQNEKQFAAVLFSHGRKAFLSFRGTDGTLVGWKEDINMAFEEEIPSEHDAVRFLEQLAPHYDEIEITGHSKGGNLAVYSAFRSSEETYRKIKAVWSFDGPGLQDHCTKEERWKDLSRKTFCFIPESSVVGLIFTAMANPIVVKSRSVGVLQHDAFNWQIMGGSLVHVEDTTLSSKFTDMTIKSFFDQCSPEERKTVVNTVYSVVALCGEEDVHSLPEGAFRNLPKMIAAMKEIPEEDRKMIWELAAALRSSSKYSIHTLIDHFIYKEK